MEKLLLVLCAAALVLLPLPAHAYFDPGSGVVMLQVLVAAIIGVGYRVRRFLAEAVRKLVARFRG